MAQEIKDGFLPGNMALGLQLKWTTPMAGFPLSSKVGPEGANSKMSPANRVLAPKSGVWTLESKKNQGPRQPSVWFAITHV